MAIVAPGDRVVVSKFDPMPLLVLCQHSGTLAKGADGSQRGNNGGADEFRAVRNYLNCFEQIFIHLEGDDFLFFLHCLNVSPGSRFDITL